MSHTIYSLSVSSMGEFVQPRKNINWSNKETESCVEYTREDNILRLTLTYEKIKGNNMSDISDVETDSKQSRAGHLTKISRCKTWID